MSHARQRPDSVAISDGQTNCSYRGLAENVVRLVDALAAIGIRRGQTIGIETSDRFQHLLLVLACEALGATTMSLQPFEFGHPMNLGRLFDHILASNPLPGFDADKTFVMTLNWLTQVLRTPVADHHLEALQHRPDPEAVVRLTKSSGTAGTPKIMAVTHRLQELTILESPPNTISDDMVRSHLRFLCFYQFSMRACHRRVMITLRLGGTVYFGAVDSAWNPIASGAVNYAVFTTGDLARFLRDAPLGVGPFNIHIEVIGAAFSPKLRQLTAQKLTKTIQAPYASNETGQIADIDENNVGTLLPSVEVLIVDAKGNPQPFGLPGLIRVKCDKMVTGYVGAPELSRETFVDGWFHSSDVGFQPSARTLVVLGRADDMLNIGGMKIPPGPVIEQIKAIEGILDAAVAGVVNAAGSEVLLVAVETGTSGPPPDFQAKIGVIIQQYASAYVLLPLSVFPRTETGKVRNEAIRDAYRQTVQP